MPMREINLEMPEALYRRVESLREREGSPSIPAMIAHAVAVYEYLIAEHDDGVQVVEMASLMGCAQKLPDSQDE